MFKKIVSLLNFNGGKQAPDRKLQKPGKLDDSTANRIGELGEYKINIQLDQLPKDCKYVPDLLLENPKSTSDRPCCHKQIGLFVIETKNYIHRKLSRLAMEHAEPIGETEIYRIYDLLNQANITDAKIEVHVNKAKAQMAQQRKG